MKYFVFSLLVLPLLVSCEVVQEEHYGSSYYSPPSQVIVQPRHTHRHDNDSYRPAPRGRSHERSHGHSDTNRNTVIINPARPTAQQNVHGHDDEMPNSHGHPDETRRNMHGHR